MTEPQNSYLKKGGDSDEIHRYKHNCSNIRSRDPRQKHAQVFLENEANKIVSELVIIELSSILSRREELVETIRKIKGIIDNKLIIIALITYILRKFRLQYIGIEDNTILLPPIGKISTVIAEALKLSHDIKLRTLDLLHLAYAYTLRELGYPIEEFITIDEDFLKRKETINKVLNINVTTI